MVASLVRAHIFSPWRKRKGLERRWQPVLFARFPFWVIVVAALRTWFRISDVTLNQVIGAEASSAS